MDVLVIFCQGDPLKRMKVLQKTMIAGYSDEFMWKEKYGSTRRKAFQVLYKVTSTIKVLSHIFPVYLLLSTCIY